MQLRKRFVFLLLAVCILGAVIFYSNPMELFPIIARSNLFYLCAGIGLAFVSLFLRVLKWRVLLENVKTRDIFPVQILGISISNMTPGKVAELGKSVILKMVNGMDISRSLPSVFWERISDLIVLVVLSLFFLNFMAIGSGFFYLGVLGVIAFAALIIAFLFVLKSKRFGIVLLNMAKKIRIARNVSDSFIESFYGQKIKKGRFLINFVLTFLAWFVDGIIFYIAFLSIGISLSPLLLLGVLSISVLIGVASSLPGGIGSTEVVMTIIIGGMGIDHTTAVAGILVGRLLTFWFSMFVGVLCFFYLSKKIDMRKIFSG